ncbi:MAG: hypothetical protein ACRYGI_18210, partial [Janthinobacterium lividum]
MSIIGMVQASDLKHEPLRLGMDTHGLVDFRPRHADRGFGQVDRALLQKRCHCHFQSEVIVIAQGTRSNQAFDPPA